MTSDRIPDALDALLARSAPPASAPGAEHNDALDGVIADVVAEVSEGHQGHQGHQCETLHIHIRTQILTHARTHICARTRTQILTHASWQSFSDRRGPLVAPTDC